MGKAIKIILEKCLGIRKNESVLIITDKKLESIARKFYRAASKIANTKIVSIPIPKVHGTEPPKNIAKMMLKYDAQILITTKSLSHTKARVNACKKGARIVTMPGITEATIRRTIDIDYNKLQKLHKKLGGIIDKGKKAKVVTKLGTNLEFSIRGRKAYGRDAGLFTKKGSFGNLPTGEIFSAPVEGSANGIYVVDASHAGIGKLKNPIKLIVKGGHAVKIIGNKSKILEKLLDSKGKKARIVAEFGIGTNEKARITGSTLEDEKVIGTCKIALGNNMGFGGETSVQLHLDGIIKAPTIFIDSRKIMDNGKFLI